MAQKTILQLEAEAITVARNHRMTANTVVPGLYVNTAQIRRLTDQQAIARALEEDPAVYAAYRAQHNARALIATLEAAGVQLRRG